MEVIERDQGEDAAPDAARNKSPTSTNQDAAQSSVPDPSPTDHAPAPIQTVLRESFVTAGSVVAAATAFVGLVEIALLVLILRI